MVATPNRSDPPRHLRLDRGPSQEYPLTKIIDHLNAQLATAWVPGFNAKRYHWTVSGPHFRDYRLRFDDLYTAAEGTIDELGERVRMLGSTPVYRPSRIEAASAVQPTDPDKKLDAAAMLKEALAGKEKAIGLCHEGIELANAASDPGTADLPIRFTQVHQKEAWFLPAALGWPSLAQTGQRPQMPSAAAGSKKNPPRLEFPASSVNDSSAAGLVFRRASKETSHGPSSQKL